MNNCYCASLVMNLHMKSCLRCTRDASAGAINRMPFRHERSTGRLEDSSVTGSGYYSDKVPTLQFHRKPGGSWICPRTLLVFLPLHSLEQTVWRGLECCQEWTVKENWWIRWEGRSSQRGKIPRGLLVPAIVGCLISGGNEEGTIGFRSLIGTETASCSCLGLPPNDVDQCCVVFSQFGWTPSGFMWS